MLKDSIVTIINKDNPSESFNFNVDPDDDTYSLELNTGEIDTILGDDVYVHVTSRKREGSMKLVYKVMGVGSVDDCINFFEALMSTPKGLPKSVLILVDNKVQLYGEVLITKVSFGKSVYQKFVGKTLEAVDLAVDISFIKHQQYNQKINTIIL